LIAAPRRTADSFHFDMEFLGRVANRIVNDVRSINRVVYDVTSLRRIAGQSREA
jgi:GMP synthase PP-ATPase subunit